MSTILAGLLLAVSAQSPDLPALRCAVGDSELVLTIDMQGTGMSGTLSPAGEHADGSGPVAVELEPAYESWGFVFENAEMTLVMLGEGAALFGDFGVADCAYDGQGDPDMAGEEQVGGTAITWGGIVRAGPGEDTARIAAVPMGVTVDLLARSDAPEWLGEYPWFRVRLPGGTEGYIAGGLLCSREGADGMFNQRDCGP